jgi:endonuclease-3
MQEPSISHKALLVNDELICYFGMPELRGRQDPLSELIQTILSQNTSDRNTVRSFAELVHRFPTWDDVLKADVQDVVEAIRVGGLAQIKAPRIKAILRQIEREHGNLQLDFLREMSPGSIFKYLTSLHGVGPKTAACVLLFSLDMPAIPVDTHVHRVSLRLGLVSPKTSAGKTQELLEALLPRKVYYPFHMNMIRLGRSLCKAARPKCAECPLNDLCDFFHLHAVDTRV